MDGSLPVELPSADRVEAFEHELLAAPQLMLDTDHVVHGGMCARSIFIPAGTVLTGARLNHDNICIVDGDITVTAGDDTVRLTGRCIVPAARGHKRAGFAHADTWWTTIWRTELTDVQAIEDELTDEADALQTRRAIAQETP